MPSTEFKESKACNGTAWYPFVLYPTSPDINPIENLFNQVGRKLTKDALQHQITDESFEQFSERVKRTLEAYPYGVIDKIIESMNKRMGLVNKAKGQCVKY